jgi:hypothetical protein
LLGLWSCELNNDPFQIFEYFLKNQKLFPDGHLQSNLLFPEIKCKSDYFFCTKYRIERFPGKRNILLGKVSWAEKRFHGKRNLYLLNVLGKSFPECQGCSEAQNQENLPRTSKKGKLFSDDLSMNSGKYSTLRFMPTNLTEPHSASPNLTGNLPKLRETLMFVLLACTCGHLTHPHPPSPY